MNGLGRRVGVRTPPRGDGTRAQNSDMSPKYLPIASEPPRAEREPNDIPPYAWCTREGGPKAEHWLSGVVPVVFEGGCWIPVDLGELAGG